MRLRRLIEALYVSFAICAVPASAAETNGLDGAHPSPVRDLDEPLPEAATALSPTAARERACALYATAHHDQSLEREAYETMRAAARLGDPDAPLYLAKFLHAGVGVRKDAPAADGYLESFLQTFVQGSRHSGDWKGRVEQVHAMVRNETCGPRVSLTLHDIERLAPPSIIAFISQPKSLTSTPGGFLAAPNTPEVSAILATAGTQHDVAKQREQACRLFKSAAGNELKLVEAYIHLRTAADCGDAAAALHVSAYLRAGVGAHKSVDLANHYLRRAVIGFERSSSKLDEKQIVHITDAFVRGDCGPPDRTGTMWLMYRTSLTPLSFAVR